MSRVANIGPRGTRRRALGAIPGLIITVCLGVYLVAAGWDRGWRLVLVVPTWLSLLGLFQAKDKTCIALAARGTCDLDSGEREIEDEKTIARIRRQSAWVIVESSFGAIVLITMFWLLVP